MKSLHFWRENGLFEINFELKWKKPAIKGSSTNNFHHAYQIKAIKLKTLHHLVLNGHYQAGWNVNQDLIKNASLFYIVFEVLRRLFYENL